MGKESKSGGKRENLDHMEQLAELFDEDHLEFEEVLLDIKQRLESLNATVKLVSRRLDDLATDVEESRQVQSDMDAKVDQLRVSLSEVLHTISSKTPPQ